MNSGEWIAAIAVLIAAAGIWTSWWFPLMLEARHREGLERYFMILLGKARASITELAKECESIAEQLKREEIKSIEATEITLRTVYLREISVERLFELFISGRSAYNDNKAIDEFFILVDSIEVVNSTGKAAYRDFMKFDEAYIKSQDQVGVALNHIINLADAIQGPLMTGPKEARVIPESFEHKFLQVYNTWLNMTDTPGILHGKHLDPYVVTSELTDQLRPICIGDPQHPASLAVMAAIRQFELSFSTLSDIRKRYYQTFSHYSSVLNSRNKKIETTATILLNRPRTDRTPWVTIFRFWKTK